MKNNKYLIGYKTNVYEAYLKLMENLEKTLFVKKNNKIIGSLTLGDFKKKYGLNFDISVIQKSKSLVTDIINQNFQFFTKKNNKNLTDHLVVPILDVNKKLIDFTVRKAPLKKIILGNYILSDNTNPLLIAEIGVNHDGSMKRAKELILAAKKSGAHFVKFQYRRLDKTYIKSDSLEVSTEATFDHLKKVNFGIKNLKKLFDYARSLKIDPICTPFDVYALKEIEALKPRVIKIASADLLNFNLIKNAVKFNVPIILSTGLHYEREIITAVNFIRNLTDNFCILHCISTYPAPLENLNLSYIQRLKKKTGCLVGYSSHDNDITPSIISAILGASLIEKHITWNKDAVGPDHNASIEPEKFLELSNYLNNLKYIVGSNNEEKILSQGEQINRTNLCKSIYAKSSLKKGKTIFERDLIIRSPSVGLRPNEINKIIGLKTLDSINKNSPILYSHFYKEKANLLYLNNMDNLGLPVRFRDYLEVNDIFKPSFVEFHLTYSDINNYNKIKDILNLEDKSIKVHSPEMFSENFIIDLASIDVEIRNKSLNELKYVIEVGNDLFIRSSKKKVPHFVINVGGHSDHNFFKYDLKQKLLDNLFESINSLDFGELKPVVQSMPPYPWHLGGRRYHNLFVDFDDFSALYKNLKIKICLDTSHSYLACKFLNKNFYMEIEKNKKYIDYIHLSDANSSDGEGLQLGEGEINFKKLKKYIETIDFIPEIWEGHIDNFHGFKIAINEINNFNSKK